MSNAASSKASLTDAPVPEIAFIHGKVSRLLQALDRSFVEREGHIRVALLAILSGHHVLLLGPPGTAKSLLARALCESLHDATFFEYLLSKFTHPDELFGPVSIPGLKEEDYRRLTEGYLPRAHIAFLDEIFKANSAILNSLLTLINERVFHHGKHRDEVPLIGIVGASNEAPDPEGGLGALYDRFLVRISVPPIADPERFLKVCLGELPAYRPSDVEKLTRAELAWLRERAGTIGVDAAARRALLRVREELATSGIDTSDRRFRWAVELLKMSALTSGRAMVSLLDVALLEHCFGDPGGDQATVRKCVRESLISPAEHDTYLAPLRQVWAELQTGAPSPDLAVWRQHTIDRLDKFNDACRRAQELLDQRLAHIEQELARTPWCIELPPELVAGLVAIRTKLQLYERASAQHRAAVAAYGPASLMISRAREARRSSYSYDGEALRVRAPTDALDDAVGLSSNGQPTQRSGYYDREVTTIAIKDVTAHYLLVGDDVSVVIPRMVAQALADKPATDVPQSDRKKAMAQTLTPIITGFAKWVRKNVSGHVPKAPALEDPAALAANAPRGAAGLD